MSRKYKSGIIEYRFRDVLSENIVSMAGALFIVVFVMLLGYAFGVNVQFSLALAAIIIMKEIISIVSSFRVRKRFFDEFLSCLDELDQKYMIAEMDFTPGFIEGRLFIEVLHDIDKSMIERIRDIEGASLEFKEYLEMWIHEVKVPLTALKLMNYNGTRDARRESEQIEKLNSYVEQILYYARADAADKDYLMKYISLEKVVNTQLKEHKELLIGNKVRITKENLDAEVVTDSKWLGFIVSQVIINSIKYKSDARDLELSFGSYEIHKGNNQETVLTISDNGIGISEADLPRVFDKTFTGENGRRGSASTGMGLYICKKLCTRLGHRISIESKQGEYTTVSISFGDNRYYEVV